MSLVASSWLINLFLLLLSGILVLYAYFTRNFNYWKDRNVPFVKPHAFFGNFKEVFLFKHIAGQHIKNMYDKMKDHRYFGIFVLDKPVLVLRDPELVKTVLVQDFNHFVNRTTMIKEDQPLIYHLLFFGKDQIWKSMRQQLTKAFTTGKLKGMIALMNEAGQNAEKYIKKHTAGKNTLDAKDVCTKYSMDIVVSYAFGLDANLFNDEDAIFFKMGQKVFDFSISTAVPQFLSFFAPEFANFFKINIIHKQVTDFLVNTLQHSLSEREKSQQKRNDLIDIVIEMKNNPEFCKEFGFGKHQRCNIVYNGLNVFDVIF